MTTSDQRTIYVVDQEAAQGLREMAFHLWKAIDLVCAASYVDIPDDGSKRDLLHVLAFWERYHHLRDKSESF